MRPQRGERDVDRRSRVPDLREPSYIILFEGPSSGGRYGPVVFLPTMVSTYVKGDTTLPLGFDRAIAPLLPVLWYCLHLPRSRFDPLRIHSKTLKLMHRLSVPHHILLLPAPWPEGLVQRIFPEWPKLVISPDSLLGSAER